MKSLIRLVKVMPELRYYTYRTPVCVVKTLNSMRIQLAIPKEKINDNNN